MLNRGSLAMSVSSGIQTCISSACEQLLCYHLHKTIKPITGHKKLKKLDNVKISNLKEE